MNYVDIVGNMFITTATQLVVWILPVFAIYLIIQLIARVLR